MQLPLITVVSWKGSPWPAGSGLGIAHCCTQIVYFGGAIVAAGILSEPACLHVGVGRARGGSCSVKQCGKHTFVKTELVLSDPWWSPHPAWPPSPGLGALEAAAL